MSWLLDTNPIIQILEYDLMIAAVALAHDLTLVTNNTGEIRRVPGLRIEDWSA